MEAISERFQQFKGGRTGVENVLILRYHVLCSKKKHSYIVWTSVSGGSHYVEGCQKISTRTAIQICSFEVEVWSFLKNQKISKSVHGARRSIDLKFKKLQKTWNFIIFHDFAWFPNNGGLSFTVWKKSWKMQHWKIQIDSSPSSVNGFW